MNETQRKMFEYVMMDYRSPSNHVSIRRNIPIDLLDDARAYYKSIGVKVRIRYRGSRTNPLDMRDRSQRMQDCTKRFADRFSVYFA